MYQNAAIIAAIVLVYSAVAGRVSRSWLSGPILFTCAGLVFGPLGLNVLRLEITADDLKTIAEASLAMVLFTDAARSDLGVLRRSFALPRRLLLIGLPLTIVLGILCAKVLFPGMDPIVAALLATILAPTDAALGAPVVTDEAVPAKIREALNVESGLNDGICVPIVIILLDLLVGTEVEHNGIWHVFQVIIDEIGIGLLVAVLVVPPSVWILRVAARHEWMSAQWLHVPVVALAGLCFTSTQALGGSGFIACFVGGLIFGYLEDRPQDLLGGATSTGDVLAMLTWIAFGGPLLGLLLHQVTWSMAAYAALSLTVVRMAPVFLALAGSGITANEKLFVGWFGPRGLASIVFAVIIFDANVPGRDTLAITTACTVLLSILAHGATANPFVAMLVRSRRDAG